MEDGIEASTNWHSTHNARGIKDGRVNIPNDHRVTTPPVALNTQYTSTPQLSAMGTLAQSIATTFMNGLLFGIYFITACFANRWLLFTSEGWKLRRRIHWMIVVVTNLIAALILIDAVLAVLIPMTQMTFVEEGNMPTAWTDFSWDPILKVSSNDSVLCPRIHSLTNSAW